MKKRLFKKLLKQALYHGMNTPRHRAAVTKLVFMTNSIIKSLPRVFNALSRGIEKMNVFLVRSR